MAEVLRATRSTPWLESTLQHPAEPLPPLAPIAIPRLPARPRKPTPTYYSIASDATKLGEIPLHKWAVPYDFDQASVLNKEAARNGWPMNKLENQDGRKKRFGFFRLFGRKNE